MDSFSNFLFQHGDLHDCRVAGVSWDMKSGRMEVMILDANANFLGLPEYEGPLPGRLLLDGVTALQGEVVVSESGKIYETSVSTEHGVYRVEIRFSPAGNLVVDCGFAAFLVDERRPD